MPREHRNERPVLRPRRNELSAAGLEAVAAESTGPAHPATSITSVTSAILASFTTFETSRAESCWPAGRADGCWPQRRRR